MLRNLIDEVLLFLIPFAIFAGWLILTKRNPLDFEHWSGWKFGLTAAGILLGIASIIYAGTQSETHTGAYSPPHMENGQLVPGKFIDKP